MKQNYNIGDLLIRLATGEPALVTESIDSERTAYGPQGPGKRRLYRLLESGQQHWKHDIQVAAEYEHTRATDL